MMTKQEMICAIADSTGLPKAAVADTIGAYLDLVSVDLLNTGKASLSGLGTLKVVERAAKTGRNPQTGKPLQIPARNAVKFTPSKMLKDRANG